MFEEGVNASGDRLHFHGKFRVILASRKKEKQFSTSKIAAIATHNLRGESREYFRVYTPVLPPKFRKGDRLL
jgi:hypothetical protein